MATISPDDEVGGSGSSFSSSRAASDSTGTSGGVLSDGSPTVSVVIPAYNPGGYLREAVRSVVAQTFTDWELIVVDDGSNENLDWVRLVDPRVSLVRQPNQGPSTARNRGIKVSRGRFIAFLDSDDRWRPTKLERQVELLRTGSVFCNTAFELIDNEGACIGAGWGGKVSYADMLAGQGILTSSSIIERTLLERAGLFDPTFRISQDVDLFLRVARTCDVSFVPTVEVEYRLHDGNRSKDYWLCARTLCHLYAREASLAELRNDTVTVQATREGQRHVRRINAFRAVEAARAAARQRSTFDTARHLVRATMLSPAVVRDSCESFAKKRLHLRYFRQPLA